MTGARDRGKRVGRGSKVYVYRKNNRRFDGDDGNGEVCFCWSRLGLYCR